MADDEENRAPSSSSAMLQPRRSASGSPLLIAFPTSSNQSDPPASARSDPAGLEELKSDATGSAQSNLTISGRKASVYPNNLAQKQMRKFARSAEKRQSIHMLGSIEHLQHHFSKVGLAAKTAPDVRGTLRPAVGPVHTSDPGDEPAQALPPSPLPPVTVERAPYPTTAVKLDLGELRQEAVDNLKAVEAMWRTQALEEDKEEEHALSVLDLLVTTIRSIRSIRNYSLALPASSLGGQSHLHPGLRRTSGSAPHVRSRQSISTPSRPTPTPSHVQAKAIDVPDPLAPLRRSAIDVLTSLRGIEERSRIDGSNVASDETGTNGDLSRSATPALSETLSNPSGPSDAEHLEEEDPWEAFFFAERGGRGEANARKPWEERITSGEEGWLYRSDLSIEQDLQAEKVVLERYLDAVETVIFPNECSRRRHGQRAWHVKASLMPNRRSSAGGRLEEPASAEVTARGHSRSPSPLPEVQEDRAELSAEPSTISEDLPLWARPGWPGTPLERLHEFLLAHLPLDLCLFLPSPTHGDFAARFLARLADGYLLIVAFNATIEKAHASWGHINAEDVHDTIGTEQDSAQAGQPAKDWTFRRVANLKCLAAALKLRYAIPLVMPSEPAPSKSIVPLQPSSETAAPDKPQTARSRPTSWGAGPSGKPSGKDKVDPIPFDPAAIARKDLGWEATLERVVTSWVDAVARELQQEDI